MEPERPELPQSHPQQHSTDTHLIELQTEITTLLMVRRSTTDLLSTEQRITETADKIRKVIKALGRREWLGIYTEADGLADKALVELSNQVPVCFAWGADGRPLVEALIPRNHIHAVKSTYVDKREPPRLEISGRNGFSSKSKNRFSLVVPLSDCGFRVLSQETVLELLDEEIRHL